MGENSIPKPTTPLVYLNEGGIEIEEQVQYVYIHASDDRYEDLDNMMMYIFGNNVAFTDPETFLRSILYLPICLNLHTVLSKCNVSLMGEILFSILIL
jgi:hypothetical protein